MQQENEDAPPPYSEVDPHSPTADTTPPSEPLTSPSRISLRGGYMRGVPFHEDAAAASYFEERAFSFRPDLPVIVLDRDITPDTTRENIDPPTRIDEARNVTQQDWQTFLNYVLTELGNETPNTVKRRKQRLTPEEFRDCQARIEAVVNEWNEAFFQPRSIKFVPHFYYNRPPSPSPSYRTTNNVQAGPSSAQPASAPVPPQDLPAQVPMNTADRGLGAVPFGGPFGRRGGPFGSHHAGPFGPWSGPFGPWNGPFGHAGGPFQRGRFPGRGRGAFHHDHHGHHHHVDFNIPPYGRGRRSRSASSSSSSSSDSDSDDSHHGHFRGRGGRRGSGGRRGRGRHRNGHHRGGRRRSSSTSSSSSDSSDASIDSFSSEDFEGADITRLRATYANFQLDPTDRRQHKAAYRQLCKDIRAQRKEARNSKNAAKTGIKGYTRSQKREFKSEMRSLQREAKSRRREAKRAYKTARRQQKRARKEAKKARKRGVSEPTNYGRVRDEALVEQTRGLNLGEQQNGTTVAGTTFTSTAEMPSHEHLGGGQSREVNDEGGLEVSRRETRRKAKEFDRQARDLERQAQEYERQAEQYLKEYEQHATNRTTEAQRQASELMQKAKTEARILERKGEKAPDLERRASLEAQQLHVAAEVSNAQDEQKCSAEVAALRSQAHETREQAELITAQARGVWDSLENGPHSSRSVPDQTADFADGEAFDAGGGFQPGAFGTRQGFGPGGGFGLEDGPNIRFRGVGFGVGNQAQGLGTAMSAWGERFGRMAERWGEDFGRRMEAHGRAIERRFA